MKYNPVQLLVDYLKVQTEMSGIPVQIDMTGHTTGSKLVVLTYAGGYRSVRDKADRWDIDISIYARTRQEAIPLIMQVREILLERVPAIRLAANKVTIADVVEVTSPYDFSDSTITGEVRYLGVYSVTAYM